MGTGALRRVVVLVMLAAGCLLIVPGVAGASVNRKYSTEYKSQLRKLDRYFRACVDAYAHNKAACLEWTEAVRDALDNPEQLLVARQVALKVYETQKDTPEHACAGFDDLVAAFKGRAARYFSSSAQRKLFKARCAGLKVQGGIAIRADAFIYLGWKALGADPPDLEMSAVKIEFGDNDLAAGQQGYAGWMAKLKALL